MESASFAVVQRAATTVRFEFHNTDGIESDRNTNERGIRLALAISNLFTIGVLNSAVLGAAGEFVVAVEAEWSVPAVTLDLEGAALSKAWRVIRRGFGVVDSLVVVVEDRQAGLETGSAALAIGSGNGAETAGGEDSSQVLGVRCRKRGCESDEGGSNRRYDCGMMVLKKNVKRLMASNQFANQLVASLLCSLVGSRFLLGSCAI